MTTNHFVQEVQQNGYWKRIKNLSLILKIHLRVILQLVIG